MHILNKYWGFLTVPFPIHNKNELTAKFPAVSSFFMKFFSGDEVIDGHIKILGHGDQ